MTGDWERGSKPLERGQSSKIVLGTMTAKATLAQPSHLKPSPVLFSEVSAEHS